MAEFTPAELAQLDALITKLQEDGAEPDTIVPLFTPVATVVTRAVIATAAVLCVKVEADAAKIKQIEELAKSLETTTTLSNLISLRSQAVQSTFKTASRGRPAQ